MDNQNCIIKVKNLTKTYKIFNKPVDRIKEALNPFHKRYSRDFHALQNVSFEVAKGETLGVIGRNGAGKSTLLKILTGVLTPSDGKINIKGNIAALLELGAGFNPELTGIQNIYLNGSIMGYSKRQVDDKIEEIVAFADIGDFINQPVKMYSSGMFARLAFSVNAIINPDILIVDEALAVGDMYFQIKCMDKMHDMMTNGTTILFVSHDINSVRRFCTKCLWLNEGKVMMTGDVNQVTDAYEDFLKTRNLKISEQFNTNSPIANILNVEIVNSFDENVKTIQFNEPLKVKVTYDVLNTKIRKPLLGISLRSINREYICGLNSFLDHVTIPWEAGINYFSLSYPQGLLVTGGTYEFDVALFEQTATVPIQYKLGIKKIRVTFPYIGEGKILIPHKWSDK